LWARLTVPLFDILSAFADASKPFDLFSSARSEMFFCCLIWLHSSDIGINLIEITVVFRVRLRLMGHRERQASLVPRDVDEIVSRDGAIGED
jgi:hypothetical protein